MEFSDKEDISVILNHVMFGLAKEGLIEQSFQFGPEEYMRNKYGDSVGVGLVFAPSALGVELFLWAYGKGDLHIARFLDLDINFISNTKINTTPGFRPVHKKSEEPVTADVQQALGPDSPESSV